MSLKCYNVSLCDVSLLRDIAPLGSTLAETNKNLDEISDLALQLQKETGESSLPPSLQRYHNHSRAERCPDL